MKKGTDSTFKAMEPDSFKLPPEAFKFGKQMGIDFQGLEPEAQELWTYLENLSRNNPLEYHKFITQQMQTAKEEEEERKMKKDATKEKKTDGGFFRPEGM
jgi:hypothetical protein